MAYRADNRSDRWKAMIGAIAVTGVLGAGILTGLNVTIVGEAVEKLRTFDISLPEPPPPEPPPQQQPRQAKDEAAPAAPKASPIVAPKPEVQLPTRQVIAAAAEAGTGASSSTGQGGAGTGTGAGGSGAGSGGGGVGSIPARLVRNLRHSDYRRLTAGRMASGSAGLAIRVNSAGRVDSCQVEHSSGDPVIDSGLCPLVVSRLRFEPARNARGQPIPYYTHYRATWRR
jgi:protein TonB